MYAGRSGKFLIAAGGANFPDGYPWEGGKKRWYDSVFIKDLSDTSGWKKLELKLPFPMAYGVSGTWRDRLYCAGGEAGPSRNDPSEQTPRILSNVFSLGYHSATGQFDYQQLPALPLPLKDACGSIVQDWFVVFGGVSSSANTLASNRLWVMNLAKSKKRWVEAPSLPARGRIQAVCATDQKSFFVVSGIGLQADSQGLPSRKMPYLQDFWRYDPQPSFVEGRWSRLPDIPVERAAAPSPAFYAKNRIYLLGGAESELHQLPQKDHPGWSRRTLYFDLMKEKWELSENLSDQLRPRVTAAAIDNGESYLIISGEISPGRRSPEIVKFDLP
jgi:N-acetylneuraminic acid mutarotase